MVILRKTLIAGVYWRRVGWQWLANNVLARWRRVGGGGGAVPGAVAHGRVAVAVRGVHGVVGFPSMVGGFGRWRRPWVACRWIHKVAASVVAAFHCGRAGAFP